MQWYTQAGNLTTNMKYIINFTLSEFNAIKSMKWGFRMDDSAIDTYNMVLCGDLLTALGTNRKCFEDVIEESDRPLKGSTAPMIDLGTYESKYSNTGKLHLRNIFMDLYVQKVFELKYVGTSTKVLHAN